MANREDFFKEMPLKKLLDLVPNVEILHKKMVAYYYQYSLKKDFLSNGFQTTKVYNRSIQFKDPVAVSLVMTNVQLIY